MLGMCSKQMFWQLSVVTGLPNGPLLPSWVNWTEDISVNVDSSVDLWIVSGWHHYN